MLQADLDRSLSNAKLWKLHPYLVSAGLLFVIMVVPFCLRKRSDFDEVYLPAAQRLQAGDDIFSATFVYPPINAWLSLPFVELPKLPRRLAWFTLNFASLLLLVTQAWRLAGGPKFAWARSWSRREHIGFALGLLGGIYYSFDALTNQQTDLLVGGLVLLGFRQLLREHQGRAGLLVGLAAGVKCTPLLGAVYFAWKGRWRAALLVPIVAVGINLLPELTHGRPGVRPRAVEWVTRYLRPMTRKSHDFGTWAAAIHYNHSLAGWTNRWFVYEPSWSDKTVQPVLRADRVGPKTLKWLIFTGCAFLSVGMIWASRRARRFMQSPSALSWSFHGRESLECSLLILLMLMFSPQSSKSHFCTLVLPAFCLARAALLHSQRAAWVCLIAALMCGLVSNKDLVGGFVYERAIWAGSVTVHALWLYVGCCWALGRALAVEPIRLAEPTERKYPRLAA